MVLALLVEMEGLVLNLNVVLKNLPKKKLRAFDQSKENWSLKQNNFDDILETKKAFLDYKSKDLEKPKN